MTSQKKKAKRKSVDKRIEAEIAEKLAAKARKRTPTRDQELAEIRKQLAKDTEEFLKKGGQIQVIATKSDKDIIEEAKEVLTADACAKDYKQTNEGIYNGTARD